MRQPASQPDLERDIQLALAEPIGYKVRVSSPTAYKQRFYAYRRRLRARGLTFLDHLILLTSPFDPNELWIAHEEAAQENPEEAVQERPAEPERTSNEP